MEDIKLDSKLPFWRKRRYHVVLMVFFGLFNLFAIRINLSVAIVAMTEKINVTLEDGSVVERQEFDWDSTTKGYLLSSFYYGYITTQILGGFLASRIGGNLGAAIPSVLAIWAQWAPVYERSFMGNVSYTGSYIGIIAAMLLSGIMGVSWGWESIFYSFGSFGCLWYLAWLFIVRANPEVDPLIKEAEKQFILSSIGDRSQVKNIKHPWKDIFTSMAVWAAVVAGFTFSWGSYTLLTQLPMFLNDTLNFNLDTTGIMASIPYMVVTALLFVSGFLADWTQVKGYLRAGQVRRFFNCGAFIVQMAFMLLTAFTTDPTLSIVFISLGVGAGAFAWSGYVVNPLDLAPSHASIIMGLSNTFGTIAGIVTPIVTGYIVTDRTRDQWRIIFYIAAGVYLFGCIFCMFFVRGNLQPWAKVDIEELANRKALKENENRNSSEL
ncbi:vesicular glutamate transporter 2-like [Phlebotomus argentipes]|uniref:vesicular glutamate transporter 2-like n=1 Tax=Phlebotomus argentipes TaxID=94469 RepID=UPI0028930697|nr:vesicular glutamate transporter 2-like [Phlebotomus argentipes]